MQVKNALNGHELIKLCTDMVGKQYHTCDISVYIYQSCVETYNIENCTLKTVWIEMFAAQPGYLICILF